MGDDCPAVGRQIGRAPVTPLVSCVDVLCTVTYHLVSPLSSLLYTALSPVSVQFLANAVQCKAVATLHCAVSERCHIITYHCTVALARLCTV